MIWGGVVFGLKVPFFVSSPSTIGASVPCQVQQGKSNTNNIFTVETNFKQELGVKRGFGPFLAFPKGAVDCVPGGFSSSC